MSSISILGLHSLSAFARTHPLRRKKPTQCVHAWMPPVSRTGSLDGPFVANFACRQPSYLTFVDLVLACLPVKMYNETLTSAQGFQGKLAIFRWRFILLICYIAITLNRFQTVAISEFHVSCGNSINVDKKVR